MKILDSLFKILSSLHSTIKHSLVQKELVTPSFGLIHYVALSYLSNMIVKLRHPSLNSLMLKMQNYTLIHSNTVSFCSYSKIKQILLHCLGVTLLKTPWHSSCSVYLESACYGL